MKVIAIGLCIVILLLSLLLNAPFAGAQATPSVTPITVTYTVKAGDTLASIATRFNVTVQAILNANVIYNANYLLPGQQLIIPGVIPTLAPTIAPLEDDLGILPTVTPTVYLSPTPSVPPTLTSTVTPTRPAPTAIPSHTPTMRVTPSHHMTSTPDSAMQTVIAATQQAVTVTPTLEIVPVTPSPLIDDLGILPSGTAPFASINGVPLQDLVLLDDATRDHIYAIAKVGQQHAIRSTAFVKIGDSTIENPHFLTRFEAGQGSYDLGDFSYLMATVNRFQGSFGVQGMAVERGMNTGTILSALWTDGRCGAEETLLTCVLRVNAPAIAFIKLGTNDLDTQRFDQNMRRIVQQCLDSGTVPILITKVDRREGSGNPNNETLRQIARDYHIPLIDMDRLADTLPGRGLAPDYIHLTVYFPYDYRNPEAFQRGYAMQNLLALITLDMVWRAAEEGQPTATKGAVTVTPS